MTATPAFFLLDIEGTTTPVDFVFKVLFPDARERLLSFLEAHAEDPEVVRDLEALRAARDRDALEGRDPPAWDGSAATGAAYAHWLMDRDRKDTPLKVLQGRIWAEGYALGRLRGVVYDDVPRALSRWTTSHRRVAIFSSGSVLAQKLLFGHSDHGDLTPFLSGFFDTTTGPKGDSASYLRIASEMGERPSAGVFVSDVVAELDAARTAGVATALIVRSPPGPTPHGHQTISSLDDLA